MVRGIAVAIAALGAAIVAPAAAWAHVGVSPTSAPAGKPLVFEVSIPHGCGGSPTTGVALRLPDGVVEAAPVASGAWSAEVAPGDDGALVATWTGGSIPDAEVAVFALEMALPAVAPGTIVHVPAIQTCAEGETRWIQVPADGEDPGSLELPAPAIEVLEPEAAPSGEATGGRHDEPSTEAVATTAVGSTSEAEPEPPVETGTGDPAGAATGPNPILLPLSVLALLAAGIGTVVFLRRRG